MDLVNFDQSPVLAVTYHARQPAYPPVEGRVMEDFAELMQRLLEVQSGGKERSPKLIAEDERLMDGLQKRIAGSQFKQTMKLGQDTATDGR